MLSFPQFLSGNPVVYDSGFPIEAFGNDTQEQFSKTVVES
jgi:hypothetical protein